MRQLKPCGTRAAYERHRRAGKPQDEACLEANRDDNKDARAKWSRCRTRAFTKLMALHPADFKALRADERAKEPGGEARSRVRQRALRRLAKKYPDIYRALLTEELAKDGGPR